RGAFVGIAGNSWEENGNAGEIVGGGWGAASGGVHPRRAVRKRNRGGGAPPPRRVILLLPTRLPDVHVPVRVRVGVPVARVHVVVPVLVLVHPRVVPVRVRPGRSGSPVVAVVLLQPGAGLRAD